MGERPLQPLLHDLVTCVRAPGTVLSDGDGQIRGTGVHGWFHADRRVLSRLVVTLEGTEPEGVAHQARGSSGASFVGVVRTLGDAIADPTVFVDRERLLDGGGLVETVTVSSTAQDPVRADLTIEFGCDLGSSQEVKSGTAPEPLAGRATHGGPTFIDDNVTVTLVADPPPDLADLSTGRLTWALHLERGLSSSIVVRASARPNGDSHDLFGARTRTPVARPNLICPDPRLGALVRRGLDDLDALLLTDRSDDRLDHFAAAGSPWYLTLFGRDALWTARMLLPLGTDLAMSTLRSLARRQGRVHKRSREEQPGKIVHEVRSGRETAAHGLPPLYYGSVDATCLFVVLLAEAWRWGADHEQVRALLPAVERALVWAECAAADSGFLQYIDASGTGLTNHGWKDSHDSVQRADGGLADPPIALCEAQAYAYQAAVLGADVLEKFGWGDPEHWRKWAHDLAERFRGSYWVGEGDDAYPAVALDANGRPVDGITSNMGHLLGTGLLNAAESDRVAAQLTSPALAGGFGLRTLTAQSPRFSRLSYHGGSVWPHDTAIAAMGLAATGHPQDAAILLDGLMLAGPAFDYRLPELYGGDDRASNAAPTAYPAACRPQAWSAAAPFAALVAVLGIEVDVPGGRVRVRGADGPLPFGPLRLEGLVVEGGRLDIAVDGHGGITASCCNPRIDLELC